MATIGEKIRELRQQRGLTQSELADGIVTPSMISQIESDRAKPSYNLLNNLAIRLGMPIEYFVTEMDGQQSASATLAIARYYVEVGLPEKALEILNKIHTENAYGLNTRILMLTQAMAHRHLGQYQSGVPILESLREQAFRSQDKLLLFEVCRESGYLELGMKNEDGALHEWKKAVFYGKELRQEKICATVELNRDMMDMYYKMYQITRQKYDGQIESISYLQEAIELAKSAPKIEHMAEMLIMDAEFLEDADTQLATTLALKALTLVESLRFLKQSDVVQATITEASEKIPELQEVSTASEEQHCIAPQTTYLFIQAECHRARAEMSRGERSAALRRIERASEILNDCHGICEFSQLSYRDTLKELGELQADYFKMNGETEKAADVLIDLANQFPEEELDIRVQWLATAILWLKEVGQPAKIREIQERLESFLLPKNPVRWIDSRT